MFSVYRGVCSSQIAEARRVLDLCADSPSGDQVNTGFMGLRQWFESSFAQLKLRRGGGPSGDTLHTDESLNHEPDRCRISHGHDLHEALRDQMKHTLTNGRWGETYCRRPTPLEERERALHLFIRMEMDGWKMDGWRWSG